jgi:hypothetical protein
MNVLAIYSLMKGRWASLGAFAKLPRATARLDMSVSVRLSVHMEQLGSLWTDFVKIFIREFFKNLSRKFKFHKNRTRMTGILHAHHCTFILISRLILPGMTNVSYRSCRENQNSRIAFSFFFMKSCSLWGSVEKYVTARQATDDITWRMRFCCWITKTPDTRWD